MPFVCPLLVASHQPVHSAHYFFSIYRVSICYLVRVSAKQEHNTVKKKDVIFFSAAGGILRLIFKCRAFTWERGCDDLVERNLMWLKWHICARCLFPETFFFFFFQLRIVNCDLETARDLTVVTARKG